MGGEGHGDRECWCPCGCGCKELDSGLLPSGLCASCEFGDHEIPPPGAKPGIEELLKQHESIVLYFKKALWLRTSVG